jgi:hypothetical protein
MHASEIENGKFTKNEHGWNFVDRFFYTLNGRLWEDFGVI